MLHIFNTDEFLKDLRIQLKDEEINEDFYSSIISLIELFKMQDSFQQKAMANDNGLQWWEVKELNGKKVDYCLASVGEVGEGIASRDFKWWAKTTEEDKENFITEIVDCLHFEASNIMKGFYSLQKQSNDCGMSLETFQELTGRAFIQFGNGVLNSFGYNNIPSNIYEVNDTNDMVKNYLLLSLMNDLETNSDITHLNNDDAIKHIKTMTEFKMFIPLFRLFEIGVSCGVTFSEMLDRYKLKNALNQVRKMNGYKEGTYIKLWPSITTGAIVEDNVVSIEEVFGKNMSLEDMISHLNNYYNEYVKPSM